MNIHQKFIDQGWVLIENYVPNQILNEIKLEILQLIKLQVEGNEIGGFELIDFKIVSNLDEAFNKLKNHNPSLTSKIYAASKKLPSLARFVTSEKNSSTAKSLMGSNNVAFSERGWGLRIDHPNDVKHSTPLHQDYHTQIGSPNGIVIWTPLTDVTIDMGPLIFYPKSDKLGVQRIKKIQTENKSTDIELDLNLKLLDNLLECQPEVKAGDAVIINYLLLHKSGVNYSSKSRWSVLSRWFDFQNPDSIKRGWHGGIQEGFKFEEVHPEYNSTI